MRLKRPARSHCMKWPERGTTRGLDAYNTAVTIRLFATAFVAATIGFTLLCTPEAAAQGTPVRVLVSNGMKAAIEELQPQCERTIGHPLVLQFNSTAGVKKSPRYASTRYWPAGKSNDA